MLRWYGPGTSGLAYQSATGHSPRGRPHRVPPSVPYGTLSVGSSPGVSHGHHGPGDTSEGTPYRTVGWDHPQTVSFRRVTLSMVSISSGTPPRGVSPPRFALLLQRGSQVRSLAFSSTVQCWITLAAHSPLAGSPGVQSLRLHTTVTYVSAHGRDCTVLDYYTRVSSRAKTTK